MNPSFRQVEIISPSIRPVSYLKLDLNDPTSLEDLFTNDDNHNAYVGLILIYDEDSTKVTGVSSLLAEWFDKKLNKENRVHNRETFKKCLLSKQKCDQLLLEAFKSLPKSIPPTEIKGLNFLLCFYDVEYSTFYLYSVGIFDFFFFNGKVSGTPIAPLQHQSKVITTDDMARLDLILSQKTFHFVFENGLTSDGFFIYAGLPIAKTNSIHNSPLLSRIFYRLKRDASPECLREMEDRLKKAFPKHPDSGLLTDFFYIFGFIPNQ
jgi:hypothetical protein